MNTWPVADPRVGGGGGAQQAPPKIGPTMFILIQLFIRMLKNNAQIARETIKTTLELPGPLSGPRPLPFAPPNENPGSAPVGKRVCLSYEFGSS